jgi:hypothetical protein
MECASSESREHGDVLPNGVTRIRDKEIALKIVEENCSSFL